MGILILKGNCCNMKEWKEVLECAELLHKMGSIIYFSRMKKLRDIAILNPSWLVRVMKSIFTSKDGWIKQGILKYETLANVWIDFPQELHPKLVALLEKFEVAHTINSEVVSKTSSRESQKSLLIPALLPTERPNLNDMWNSCVGSNCFSRVFQFTYFPAGFFSRLMTCLVPKATCLIGLWARGMLATSESDNENSLFLVDHTPELQHLIISVKGSSLPHARNIFKFLIETVERFTGELKGDFKVQRYVKLFPDKRDSPLYLLDDLKEVIADAKNTILVEGKEYSLEELVPDLVLAEYKGRRVTEQAIVYGEVLGVGGFGTVYIANLFGEKVAVKKMKVSTKGKEAKFRADFSHEVLLQCTLKHKNLVSVIAICLSPMCIITELCEYGNLYNLLHGTSEIVWSLRLNIANDIADGMKYLHGKNPPIGHLDLKTPNILLYSLDPTSIINAKIADFGTAQYVDAPLTTLKVENPVWCSPELLAFQPYTEKVDIYSFGVILWELLTRRDFFGEISWLSVLHERVIAGDRPKIPECPDSYKSLISQCWHQDPAVRPQFARILIELKDMRQIVKEFSIYPIFIEESQPDASEMSSEELYIPRQDSPSSFSSPLTKKSHEPVISNNLELLSDTKQKKEKLKTSREILSKIKRKSSPNPKRKKNDKDLSAEKKKLKPLFKIL